MIPCSAAFSSYRRPLIFKYSIPLSCTIFSLGITSCCFAGRIAQRSDQHSKNSAQFFTKFYTPKRWVTMSASLCGLLLSIFQYYKVGGVLPLIGFTSFIFLLEDLHQRWVFWRTGHDNWRGQFVRNDVQSFLLVPNDKNKQKNKRRPVNCFYYSTFIHCNLYHVILGFDETISLMSFLWCNTRGLNSTHPSHYTIIVSMQCFFTRCVIHLIWIIKMLTHSLLVNFSKYLIPHSAKPRAILKFLVHR